MQVLHVLKLSNTLHLYGLLDVDLVREGYFQKCCLIEHCVRATAETATTVRDEGCDSADKRMENPVVQNAQGGGRPRQKPVQRQGPRRKSASEMPAAAAAAATRGLGVLPHAQAAVGRVVRSVKSMIFPGAAAPANDGERAPSLTATGPLQNCALAHADGRRKTKEVHKSHWSGRQA